MVTVTAARADTIFVYSSVNSIYGINLTTGEDQLLTTAGLSPTVNALATNSTNGLVYYGDDTSIYYWDPALGAGQNAHVLINNFENGLYQAPITNINSAGGSFFNGKYYLGSEDDDGFVEEIYELTLSADGRQLTGVTPLGLLTACACSKFQMGGFGDFAVVEEGGVPVMYGSTADLTQNGTGTNAGIWRFEFVSGSWNLLNQGFGGQMSNSPDGQIFTNVGNSIREVNTTTGAISNQSLMTTSAAIWDFTGGFSFDFGDAADSYGAAIHLVDGFTGTPVVLGQQPPDNEAYTQNGAVGGVDGLGDDQSGVQDEDALSAIPELFVGDTSYEITLRCTSGFASAWIDINLNGTFDFNERNSNYPVACVGDNTVLSWTGINVANAGDSFMRIRAATNSQDVFRPTGFADSGEVEDYRLPITSNTVATGNCPAGSVSHVYTSTDVPITYSGTAVYPVTSTISVPDSLLITDVNVLNLDAQHTTQRRLYFLLEKSGRYAYLYGNTCTSNTNLNVSFDDEAASGVPCPPQAGQTYTAFSNLSRYDGSQAQGNWNLHIFNQRNSTSGRLDGWALEICAVGQVVDTPDIRLGKVVDVNDSLATMTFAIKNTGNVPVSNIAVTDNLTTVFGQTDFVISSPVQILSAPSGFSISTSYTGENGADVIGFGSTPLQPDDEITFSFVVDVDTSTLVGNNTFENQGVVSAISTDGSSLDDLSGAGLALDNDSDAPSVFVIDSSLMLSGIVFLDSSDSSGTSHDGIQQSNETGVVGREVTLINVASGDEILTTVTANDGSFSVVIDPAYAGQTIAVQVTPNANTQFISEMPNTGGQVSDGYVELVLDTDSANNVVNVGLIEKPTLENNQTQNVSAGESISYFHTFMSPTPGQVAFTLAVNNSSPIDNWNQTLYLDNNCNQQIDSADTVYQGSVSTQFQETICLAIVVDAPQSPTLGATQSIQISSDFYPDDVAQTGHNVVLSTSNNDLTTVVNNLSGNLVLEKSVTNITLGGQPVEQNNALPGHVLEYAIDYRNTGSGNVLDLEINDVAPAFTQIVPISTSCSSTPSTMQCSPSQSGDQVRWVFQGPLEPGAEGQVSYRVLID